MKNQVLLIFFALAFLQGCKLGDSTIKGWFGGGGDDPTGGTDKVLISNSEPIAPLMEGNSLSMVVVFNKPIPKDSFINWTIDNGASDFDSASGQMSLAKGVTSKTLQIKPKLDSLYEGSESFQLVISGEASVFHGEAQFELSIDDQESPPVVGFLSASQTVGEGDGAAAITVTLSGASAFATEVQWVPSGTATHGLDYTGPGTFTVPSGQVSEVIALTLLDDALSEGGAELVTFTLDTVLRGSATVDPGNSVHTINISDNDGASSFSITGATGGTDSLADSWLTDGNEVTVQWTNSTGETSYDVAVYQNDGTTLQCGAPVNVGADVTSHTFSGCSLTEGATYKISVQVNDSLGGTSAATNNMYDFTVDTSGPSSFSISGATGGSDSIADNALTDGNILTASWGDAVGETGYSVAVYSSDESTEICATQSVSANTTSHTFSGCSLTTGQTYKIKVSAFDDAGRDADASNDMYAFSLVTAPTTFNILGVTGGASDSTIDSLLEDGIDPIIHWEDSAGESSYNVTIYEGDGTTVHCPTQSVAANTSTFTFSGCSLTLDGAYKISVVAKDSSSNDYPAANDKFNFTIKAGLYLDGSGGSYRNGVPLTDCGGADTCDSSNPYVLDGAITVPRIKLDNGAVVVSGEWTSGTPAPGNGVLEVEASDEISICATCKIHMDFKGYTPGNGPGRGGDAMQSSGGSHGGEGKDGNAAPGTPYGSINLPDSMGSGPGRYSNYCLTSTVGGGLIKLKAQKLIANGTISASGANSCSHWIGGAAGGGVFIDVDSVTGSGGRISANGGNGSNTYASGSGGGGRIAILYNSDDTTNGILTDLNLEAFGGVASVSKGGVGGNGSIYLSEKDVGSNVLVVNNNGNSGNSLGLLVQGSRTFDKVVVNNKGLLKIEATDTLTTTTLQVSNGIVDIAGTLVHDLPKVDFHLIDSGGTFSFVNNDAVVSGTYEFRHSSGRSFNSFTVESGGLVTHTSNALAQNYTVDVSAGSITIQAGGTIDVSAKGFNNTGTGSPAVQNILASGGGYGGNGADSVRQREPEFAGGVAYGDLRNPQSSGSGGGYFNSMSYGGGVIKLNATSDLNLGGTLSANGSGVNMYNGAGSGGAIQLSASSLSGSGATIQANGGNSDGTSVDAGGSGGGGRISLRYQTMSYTGGISGLLSVTSAFGGTGGRTGGAGTIFYQDTDTEANGNLLVDNNGASGADTPIVGSYTFDKVEVVGGGRLKVNNGSSLAATSYVTTGGTIINSGTYNQPLSVIDFRLIDEGGSYNFSSSVTIASGGTLELRSPFSAISDLVIQNGGLLTHTPNFDSALYGVDLTVSNLTIEDGGEIDASGRGYYFAKGPCTGTSGGNGAGGAGHGGYGGHGQTRAGGASCGDIKNPTTLGSGGGNGLLNGGSYAGKGGGLVKLNVTNTLTVHGAIRANGDGGLGGAHSAGAGAGGSINITAVTLDGSATGVIEADGGAGGGSNSTLGGGGGGGGRIAIDYQNEVSSALSSLAIHAYGGNAANIYAEQGGAGSLYLFHRGVDTDGHLLVANNNLSRSAATPLRNNADVFDSIAVQDRATLDIPTGFTLNLVPVMSTGGRIINNGTYAPLLTTLDFHYIENGTTNYGTSFTIANGGTLESYGTGAITLTSLTMLSGSTLTHSSNGSSVDALVDLVVTQDFDLTSGSVIDVSGRGYSSDNGPGAGGQPSSNLYAGGGGAYGGDGGAGYGGSGLGGTAYGTDGTAPNNLGSGGGSADCLAGAGGGLVRITVAGTLTLNGTVDASGATAPACTAQGGGGGAGGGIDITAGTITGSTGLVTANGGAGGSSSDDGGGGGGGKIAVKASGTDNYNGGAGLATLSYQVNGGSSVGGVAGSPGSMYTSP